MMSRFSRRITFIALIAACWAGTAPTHAEDCTGSCITYAL